MVVLEIPMSAFVAAVSVVLGWIGILVRRIDKRTELVEDHDRVLFGDERVLADGLKNIR